MACLLTCLCVTKCDYLYLKFEQHRLADVTDAQLCEVTLTGYAHVEPGLRSSWWRHQMETFSALLDICTGNSPVTGEFPAQRPVTQSFDVFFDLRLNKRLSKQWWGWWFEMPSHPLWRQCNVKIYTFGFNTKIVHLRMLALAQFTITLPFCGIVLLIYPYFFRVTSLATMVLLHNIFSLAVSIPNNVYKLQSQNNQLPDV